MGVVHPGRHPLLRVAHPEVRGVGVVEGLQGLHGGARLGSWYELHWIQSTKKNEVVGEVLPKHTQSCNHYFYAIFKFLSCSRTQKTPRFAELKTLNTRYKPIICEILFFLIFFLFQNSDLLF